MSADLTLAQRQGLCRCLNLDLVSLREGDPGVPGAADQRRARRANVPRLRRGPAGAPHHGG